MPPHVKKCLGRSPLKLCFLWVRTQAVKPCASNDDDFIAGIKRKLGTIKHAASFRIPDGKEVPCDELGDVEDLLDNLDLDVEVKRDGSKH